MVRNHEILLITSGRENVMTHHKMYIMSYELSIKMCPRFLERGVNIAIVDEAHYLKSWNS